VGIVNLSGSCTCTADPPEIWDAEAASGQVPVQVVVESVCPLDRAGDMVSFPEPVTSTVSIKMSGESTT